MMFFEDNLCDGLPNLEDCTNGRLVMEYSSNSVSGKLLGESISILGYLDCYISVFLLKGVWKRLRL